MPLKELVEVRDERAGRVGVDSSTDLKCSDRAVEDVGEKWDIEPFQLFMPKATSRELDFNDENTVVAGGDEVRLGASNAAIVLIADPLVVAPRELRVRLPQVIPNLPLVRVPHCPRAALRCRWFRQRRRP